MKKAANGWHISAVADVGVVDLGRQRHPDWHTGPNMRPYLRVANVFEDRIDCSDLKEMDFTGALERYRLHPGDVLLNEGQTPELLGRPAIYRGVPDNVAFTNTLIRFRAGPEVLPEWALIVFRHYMHSGRFAKESRITTNIAHLSASRFKRVEFPVPPIDQQLKIVEILDRHLSRLDAADALLEVSQRRADALREAMLGDLFRRADTHSLLLGEVASWSSGGTPSAGRAEFYKGGDIPWCNSGDLNNGRLSMVPKRITQSGLENSSAKWIPPGCVLIAMYGATIGRVSINDVAMTTNQAVAAARPDDGLISTDYLFWFIRSQLRNLRAAGKGGAQPNISQSLLKAWPISLPSREHQAKVVREAETADASAKRLHLQIAAMGHRVEALRRSLLRAAFEGRLAGHRMDDKVIEELAGV